MDRVLDDLDFSAGSALAVDRFAAIAALHTGAEPDLAGTLDVALLMRVMHYSNPFSTFSLPP